MDNVEQSVDSDEELARAIALSLEKPKKLAEQEKPVEGLFSAPMIFDPADLPYVPPFRNKVLTPACPPPPPPPPPHESEALDQEGSDVQQAIVLSLYVARNNTVKAVTAVQGVENKSRKALGCDSSDDESPAAPGYWLPRRLIYLRKKYSSRGDLLQYFIDLSPVNKDRQMAFFTGDELDSLDEILRMSYALDGAAAQTTLADLCGTSGASDMVSCTLAAFRKQKKNRV